MRPVTASFRFLCYKGRVTVDLSRSYPPGGTGLAWRPNATTTSHELGPSVIPLADVAPVRSTDHRCLSGFPIQLASLSIGISALLALGRRTMKTGIPTSFNATTGEAAQTGAIDSYLSSMRALLEEHRPGDSEFDVPKFQALWLLLYWASSDSPIVSEAEREQISRFAIHPANRSLGLQALARMIASPVEGVTVREEPLGRQGLSELSKAGPDPLIAPPKPAALRSAMEAYNRNPQSISSSDATTLAEWCVFAARWPIRSIHANHCERSHCGIGQAAIAYALDDLDVPENDIFVHQAYVLFGNGTAHSFITAKIGTHAFIFDTTFRQFFEAAKEGSGKIGYPGFRFRTGDEQTISFANGLLLRGFAPLTDQTATIYGRNMASGDASFDPKKVYLAQHYLQKFGDQTLDVDRNHRLKDMPQPVRYCS
jgi:hypothetical protein